MCSDIQMSVYKQRHLDDTDKPQDVGLSSEGEIMGMAEQVGVSRRILTQLPGAPSDPGVRLLLLLQRVSHPVTLPLPLSHLSLRAV